MPSSQTLIQAKKTLFEKRIAEATSQLNRLREECQHVDAVPQYKADTGNWCKGDDRYWIEYRCPDCGKFWTEDQ